MFAVEALDLSALWVSRPPRPPSLSSHIKIKVTLVDPLTVMGRPNFKEEKYS